MDKIMIGYINKMKTDEELEKRSKGIKEICLQIDISSKLNSEEIRCINNLIKRERRQAKRDFSNDIEQDLLLSQITKIHKEVWEGLKREHNIEEENEK